MTSTTPKPMQVQRIHISNILGIDEIEFAPGSVTEITGRNGSGKTSIIEAIKSALGGGSTATLLRSGEDVGEVVLLLDDGSKIRKRVTQKSGTLTVSRDDVGVMGAGQGYLNQIQDALGLSPIELLTAPPSKRGQYLLEALPLEVTAEQLQEAAGDIPTPDPKGRHALSVIALVRRACYDQRTGSNRIAKEKKTTAEQLGTAIAGIDEDVDGLRKTQNTLAEEVMELKLAEGKSRKAARDAHIDRADKLMSWRDSEIERVRNDYSARLEASVNTRESEIGAAAVDVTPQKEKIAALGERIDASVRAEAARDTRDTMLREAAEASEQSDLHTEAIKRLDALKSELLTDSPLGVEVGEDGELYRDGIPFPRLNKAQQVEIAMGLAMARAGGLPIICVDGLEVLDTESYEAFLAQAEQAGVQLIATRVADTDLSISTREPVEAG